MAHSFSTHCNSLQSTATHCCALLHTATHCYTLLHTATHRNKLQHTATHQHTNTLQRTATHCNALQHTATYCNTLHYTATHCDTLQHMMVHPTKAVLYVVCACNTSIRRVVRASEAHQICMCCSVLQCVAMCCTVLWMHKRHGEYTHDTWSLSDAHIHGIRGLMYTVSRMHINPLKLGHPKLVSHHPRASVSI